VATAYIHPETGEEISSFPADLDLLGRVKVVYYEMPGWNKSTTGVKRYDDLHPHAKSYVEYIEKFVNVPVKYIGTGPDRNDMITR